MPVWPCGYAQRRWSNGSGYWRTSAAIGNFTRVAGQERRPDPLLEEGDSPAIGVHPSRRLGPWKAGKRKQMSVGTLQFMPSSWHMAVSCYSLRPRVGRALADLHLRLDDALSRRKRKAACRSGLQAAISSSMTCGSLHRLAADGEQDVAGPSPPLSAGLPRTTPAIRAPSVPGRPKDSAISGVISCPSMPIQPRVTAPFWMICSSTVRLAVETGIANRCRANRRSANRWR